MSDTKPSARAMAAAEAIVGDAYFITTFAERLAHYIDQEMPAHDELLAACKLVIDTAGVWRPNLASLIPEATLEEVSKALALAEPEQKENER